MDWLEAAMDCGIIERDFWEMTFAEINRHIESHKRQKQQEAAMDYILADLIGRSVSRVYSSTAKMPTIAEAYPALFNAEDINQRKQEQQDNLSALRFKQFAASFNQRWAKNK